MFLRVFMSVHFCAASCVINDDDDDDDNRIVGIPGLYPTLHRTFQTFVASVHVLCRQHDPYQVMTGRRPRKLLNTHHQPFIEHTYIHG